MLQSFCASTLSNPDHLGPGQSVGTEVGAVIDETGEEWEYTLCVPLGYLFV